MSISELRLRAPDGASLHMRIVKPDAPAKGVVCLVHGLGDHGGCFSSLTDFLCRASFAAATVDLHGNGASDGKRGYIADFEIFYDDISLLLNQMEGLFPSVPVFLYGHSLGGILVLNYVLRRKPSLAGVISSSPWLELAEHAASRRRMGALVNRLWPGFTVDMGLEAAKLSHDAAFVESYGKDPLVHGKISARLLYLALKSGAEILDHGDVLALPLLLMHGSEDTVTTPAATMGLYNKVQGGNATLKIWDGCFHSLHNEKNRAEIFEFVLSFLEKNLINSPGALPD